MARHRFVVDGVEHVVTVEAGEGASFGVTIDAADPIEVQAQIAGGLVTTFEAGRPSRAFVARHARGQEQGFNVTVDGRRFEVRAASASRRGRSVVGGAEDPPGKVSSPLAGVVVAVNVAVGDHVEAGAVLAVVEAMKMQNEVHAPLPGTITAVRVEAGARCERGDLLIEYTPDA